MALLADEVEVARVVIGRLEARAALAEVDFTREALIDHPLQRAVDGGAADAGVIAAYEAEEIVGAEVAFLFEEGPQDLFALSRSFAACGTQAGDIRKGSCQGYSVENDEPQPQVEVAFGFLIVKPPPVTVSTKSTSAPFR